MLKNSIYWVGNVLYITKALLINSATRQQIPCGCTFLSSVAGAEAFLVL